MKENTCHFKINLLKCSAISLKYIHQTKTSYCNAATFHFVFYFPAQLHFLLQAILLSFSMFVKPLLQFQPTQIAYGWMPCTVVCNHIGGCQKALWVKKNVDFGLRLIKCKNSPKTFTEYSSVNHFNINRPPPHRKKTVLSLELYYCRSHVLDTLIHPTH